jgi:hypothetical protein
LRQGKLFNQKNEMRTRGIFLVSCTALFLPNQGEAQSSGFDRLFPHVRYFASPFADPLEPRLGLGLLQTNLFKAAALGRERSRPLFIPDPDDAGFDVNAVTSIGGTLPTWHLKQYDDGGIVVALQAGVHGRFRIEYPTREDVGQDWFVGVPIEVARGPWSGRLRFMHRSSHLGDELVETTGASRVEVGGEYVDFLAARNFSSSTRVYGGAAWIFRSYTEFAPVLLAVGRGDRTMFQLGGETGWYPWLNGRMGWIAGLDWRRAQRTGWQDSFAAAGGLSVKTPARGARLLVRYFNGASLLEQFFLTHEHYWSLELVTDF